LIAKLNSKGAAVDKFFDDNCNARQTPPLIEPSK
jgi:hypothetical protein